MTTPEEDRKYLKTTKFVTVPSYYLTMTILFIVDCWIGSYWTAAFVLTTLVVFTFWMYESLRRLYFPNSADLVSMRTETLVISFKEENRND